MAAREGLLKSALEVVCLWVAFLLAPVREMLSNSGVPQRASTESGPRD